MLGQVQGAVAGFGLSLMNACDLVVAADNAYFASAYRAIAFTADGGGILGAATPRRHAPRDGDHAAGERFDAPQALAWGLVNRVVPLQRSTPRSRPSCSRSRRAHACDP